jgi:hypothetical protein
MPRLSLWKQKKIWAATFTVLVDKGYHNGGNAQCISNNITTIVSYARNKQSVTHPDYLVAQFQYNKSDDTYTCPQEKL